MNVECWNSILQIIDMNMKWMQFFDCTTPNGRSVVCALSFAGINEKWKQRERERLWTASVFLHINRFDNWMHLSWNMSENGIHLPCACYHRSTIGECYFVMHNFFLLLSASFRLYSPQFCSFQEPPFCLLRLAKPQFEFGCWKSNCANDNNR